MSAAITLMRPSDLKRKRDTGMGSVAGRAFRGLRGLGSHWFPPRQYMSATGMVAKSKYTWLPRLKGLALLK